MTAVLPRTLRSERRSIGGWVLGVTAIGLITTGSWPGVAASTEELSRVLESLPPAFAAFFGEGMADFSAAGLIGSRLFGTVGLLLFIGFAVSRGARSIAGEEAAGTLELVVTAPVSRRAIAVDKVLATLVALGFLVALQAALLLLMMPAVGLSFPLGHVLGASLGLYLLAAMFGMLAFAVGAATGSRGLAVGVAAGSAAALFLLTGLGLLVRGLERPAELSPFTHFDGTVVLTEGVQGGTAGAFFAVGLVCIVAGVLAFERRDVT